MLRRRGVGRVSGGRDASVRARGRGLGLGTHERGPRHVGGGWNAWVGAGTRGSGRHQAEDLLHQRGSLQPSGQGCPYSRTKVTKGSGSPERDEPRAAPRCPSEERPPCIPSVTGRPGKVSASSSPCEGLPQSTLTLPSPPKRFSHTPNHPYRPQYLDREPDEWSLLF